MSSAVIEAAKRMIKASNRRAAMSGSSDEEAVDQVSTEFWSAHDALEAAVKEAEGGLF